SFHIGVNCDAIAVEGDQLHVRRRGRTIAVAALPAPGRGWRQRWAVMLFPRHAGNEMSSRPSGAPATGLQWEDLLRPRDRNRR
ncbi:MAG TPA: hypothetical protein VMU46_05045, partial [Burkholderiales bacterium]|nr:hypothetical protein [Burkholderiales bacterium]